MSKANKKWYWTAIGTITLTIVSDNIAERTKELPILNWLLFPFRWLYNVAARFLNINVKMWSLILIAGGIYLLVRLSKRLATTNAPAPAFINYTSDKFHLWTWKWRWAKSEEGWGVDNLAPYCSNCDVELGINLFARTARCPACKTQYGFYGTSEDFENASDAEKLIRAKANKMIPK